MGSGLTIEDAGLTLARFNSVHPWPTQPSKLFLKLAKRTAHFLTWDERQPAEPKHWKQLLLEVFGLWTHPSTNN